MRFILDHHSPARARVRSGASSRLSRIGSLGVLAVVLAGAAFVAQMVFAPHGAQAAGAHVDSVTFNRDVDPASAHFLTDAISTAEGDGASLLLVSLDTPGGDLDSMKSIVQAELASTIPIVVYVSPQGGRAASAGTFVALAAPVVAMAPNTRIGAASPVDSSGQNLPTTLDTKIKNDLEAQMTTLQETFHRNVPLAVKTISDATSFDVATALQSNLVDYEEPTQQALLLDINGKAVTLANGQTVTLSAAGLPVETLQPTLANQLETVFLDPTLLFLLFIVAAICIYLELSHPGAIVPGTIGAIALVLFLFGAGSLNPNWTGLVLMLLAIVLLAVDVRVPTHGVLTVGALISLVVGSLIFFDSGVDRGAPAVSPDVVIAVAAGVGLVSLIVIRYAILSQRGRVETGGEGLIGKTAVVTVPLAPEGRVRLLGEDWTARLAEPETMAGQHVAAQALVRVIARHGLTLIVEPARLRIPEQTAVDAKETEEKRGRML